MSETHLFYYRVDGRVDLLRTVNNLEVPFNRSVTHVTLSSWNLRSPVLFCFVFFSISI